MRIHNCIIALGAATLAAADDGNAKASSAVAAYIASITSSPSFPSSLPNDILANLPVLNQFAGLPGFKADLTLLPDKQREYVKSIISKEDQIDSSYIPTYTKQTLQTAIVPTTCSPPGKDGCPPATVLPVTGHKSSSGGTITAAGTAATGTSVALDTGSGALRATGTLGTSSQMVLSASKSASTGAAAVPTAAVVPLAAAAGAVAALFI